MKAVAWVESPDHVCCRYRVRAFVPELARRGWSVECRSIPAGVLQRWIALRGRGAADTVLLQRKLFDAFQIRLLRRSALRLVFDFDDAVALRDSYAAKGSYSRRRGRRFRRTLAMSDAVIAGNGFLAEQAAQFTDPRCVHVIPTCIDMAHYPETIAREACDDRLDLVWIGSASTLRGMERARPLLEAIGRAVPGVRLRVVCDGFPAFEHLPVVPVPWSAASEAAELARAHVGISWLPDDDWSRGKCGLKLLQYMAAGLPVVTNPVGVHREMVEHGASGFLAESEADWIEVIHALRDPERRAGMGRRGRQIVAERYSVSRWAPVVARVLAA